MTPLWYVVTNFSGVVLGVYGAALGSEAEAQSSRAESLGDTTSFVAEVHRIHRPYIGEKL
jgi:hypothetical protein